MLPQGSIQVEGERCVPGDEIGQVSGRHRQCGACAARVETRSGRDPEGGVSEQRAP
jgi:hypothetical protein